MKRIFFVFLWGYLMLFITEAWGQEIEVRQGTYPDGALRYKGHFKAGKPVGEMKRYYPDGKLQAVMNYQEDTVEAVLYSRKSDCRMEGKYVAQKKQGTWKYWNNDRLLLQEEYLDQVLEGKSVRYFPSGKVAEEKQWKEGRPDGEWKLYYDNGQLRMVAWIKSGKLEGAVKSYSYEGILRSEGKYTNDRKEDVWRFYGDQGEVVRQIAYRSGIPEDAEQGAIEESRQLDALLLSAKKIPDPAVFADDPETYMKITGME